MSNFQYFRMRQKRKEQLIQEKNAQIESKRKSSTSDKDPNDSQTKVYYYISLFINTLDYIVSRIN